MKVLRPHHKAQEALHPLGNSKVPHA
uniref:Uncharacterized protein n=1 Tax=Triticum urartu TaxID=4572 RepID=A0A8R7Q5H6_TRIUA